MIFVCLMKVFQCELQTGKSIELDDAKNISKIDFLRRFQNSSSVTSRESRIIVLSASERLRPTKQQQHHHHRSIHKTAFRLFVVAFHVLLLRRLVVCLSHLASIIALAAHISSQQSFSRRKTRIEVEFFSFSCCCRRSPASTIKSLAIVEITFVFDCLSCGADTCASVFLSFLHLIRCFGARFGWNNTWTLFF